MAERGILVLGAGGFIGRALVARLAARGEQVVAAVRTPAPFAPGVTLRAGSLSAATDWPALLQGSDRIVHLASRAHAPPAPGEAWIEDEAATAAALGRAARAACIERILLLSSIKVHGDAGANRIRASDPPAPADAYGRAKLRLEQALAASGAAWTVLRPPLVVGPGVKGNLRTLLRLVRHGVPLPLASIANRRSFICIDNLLDLIETALTEPNSVGQAFLLRDDREVSTPELIRLIAAGLGRPARLLPCPPAMLGAMARLAGRAEDFDRLTGSLVVDDSATRQRLGWRPRIALEDGIAAACRAFRDGAD